MAAAYAIRGSGAEMGAVDVFVRSPFRPRTDSFRVPRGSTLRELLRAAAQRYGVRGVEMVADTYGKRRSTQDALRDGDAVSIRPRGALRGGKGGFGALLRSSAKGERGKTTTDFGSCRDLNGRRLRHVNDEISMEIWERMSPEERAQAGRQAPAATRSGIEGWHLSIPKWADGLKPKKLAQQRRAAERERERELSKASAQEEERERAAQKRRAERDAYVASGSIGGGDAMADAVAMGLKKRRRKGKRSQRALDALCAQAGPLDGVLGAPTGSAKWLSPLVGRADVSADGRCESASEFATVCVNGCALREGRWYYEALLLSGGLMQIGVADHSFQGNESSGDGVGDDAGSWAFDGFRCRKWNGKDAAYGTAWSAGDVVGVCIDATKRELRFFLNGKDLGKAFGPAALRSASAAAAGLAGLAGLAGFFPAFSMNEGEAIAVNVGQAPWRFDPPEGARPVLDAMDESLRPESAAAAAAPGAAPSGAPAAAKRRDEEDAERGGRRGKASN